MDGPTSALWGGRRGNGIGLGARAPGKQRNSPGVAEAEQAEAKQTQWFKVKRMCESEIQCNGNDGDDHQNDRGLAQHG